MIYTSIEELTAAFTEWERQYRENPELFLSEQEKLQSQTPETYGEACAPYFAEILRKVQNRPYEPVAAGEAKDAAEAVRMAEGLLGPAVAFGNGNIYEFRDIQGPVMLVWDDAESSGEHGGKFRFMRTC
jgi:hypothetical protein